MLNLINSNSRIETENARKSSNFLLVELFKKISLKLDLDYFYEVGARQADFSYWLAINSSKTQIICYEANPYSFREFSSRFNSLKNVRYIHSAIGSNNGKVDINIPIAHLKNSSDFTLGTTSIGKRMDLDDVQSIESEKYHKEIVPCRKLDSECSNLKNGHFSYGLWLDVEGQQHQVLSGGKLFFSNLSCAFIEVEDKKFWEGQLQSGELLLQLYNKFRLVPVAKDCEGQYQYNVVLVREELIPSLSKILGDYFSYIERLRGTNLKISRIDLIKNKTISDESPIEVDFDVSDKKYLQIFTNIRGGKSNQNCLVLKFDFFNAGGNEIELTDDEISVLSLVKSPNKSIVYYRYVGDTYSGKENDIEIKLPNFCKKVKLTFIAWGGVESLSIENCQIVLI